MAKLRVNRFGKFKVQFAGASGSVFSAQAKALFNTVDIPTKVKPYYATVIDKLVEVGVWDKPGFRAIMCTPGIEGEEYLTDIKSLTQIAKYQKPGDVTGQFQTANARGSSKGYLWSGSDSHIHTGYIPNDLQTTNDYCTIIVTYESVSNSTGFVSGGFDGTSSNLFTPRRTTDQLWWQSWTGSGTGRVVFSPATGEAGVYMINRKASNDVDVYVNGSVVKNQTTADGSTPTVATFLNTYNNNGTPITRDNRTPICAYFVLENSLSDADAVALSNVISTWQTNMEMIEGSFDKNLILDGNSHCVVQWSQFHRNIEREFIASGYNMENFGVAGQTTAQMEADAASQIDPIYNAGYSKNLLVVMEGTNDAHTNGFAAAKTNMSTYVASRQAAGWSVAVCQIMARSSSSNFDGLTQEGYDLATDDFNTWLDGGGSGADAIISCPPEMFVYRSDYGSDAAYSAAMTALRLNTLDGVHWPASYLRLWKNNQATGINSL